MDATRVKAQQWAEEQDAADPLSSVRGQFDLPRQVNGDTAVYCCGHSLGPRPRRAAGYVQEVLDAWGARAVAGHFTGDSNWSNYAEALAAPSARLVGAQPAQVSVMHSLSINLHLMLASFYRPEGERRRILIEQPAFPSDRYAVVSQIQWHGLDPAVELIQVGPRTGEITLREEDLLARIAAEGPRLALVLIGGVNYYTGQAFDLAAITRAAHAVGAIAGFDLAHAAGNVPITLDDAGADFAVWCGYKYLCGGPGAPAAAYVNERRTRGSAPLPRLAGWWGNRGDTRFDMLPAFEPEAGAAGWNVSCPSPLGLAGLRAGLEIFDGVSAEARTTKSRALTAAFARWSDEFLPSLRRVSPAAPTARGGQWSLDLGDQVARVHQHLQSAGIVGDTRGPILRLAFHPLYNTYRDVLAAVRALASALA